MERDGWRDVVDLIERVVGEDELMPSVVAGVRGTVREVAALPAADIAGHTRALLAAATRALAARRGPTEAELSFVEELGSTRARQGVPIEAVLGAIHVAERVIWSRAREAANGLEAHVLLDVRELYEDWAHAVRARLISAHRAADAGRHVGERDLAALRRLLEGGSAATLAAAEAGLPPGGGLWVLVARPGDGALEQSVREHGPALLAHVDGLLVGVFARAPGERATGGGTAGLAGPAEPEELGAVRRLALAALTAAESTGRGGVTHVADVAVLAAVADRADLAAMLTDRHRPAMTALGPHARPVAQAVRAWLECGRDVPAAATRLFVHANTVRNRVHRFADLTGIDPTDPFGALNAWWLCGEWLAQGAEPAGPRGTTPG
ncbi:PucR family transcriptional regulator [Streptomyces sp. AJS327]|uniref:helix-turn-helix domain-containing protein n=1 Tax=Streptomyces sp. AJS327 TaxID=2545265 RepID=UPI0015DE58E5|nr:helix-turn-helix domain-containing protein [Streptomyces sp. AJS327]MBA0051266.1 PucR family transcriptional regulator [Streptomyces sp. AJS327]UYV85225.1 helix-turn-helix domain protein [Streptomyces sp. AJS327]